MSANANMVSEIRARLRVVDDQPSALAWLIPMLRTALDAYGAGGYGIAATASGLRLSYGFWSGSLGDRTTAEFNGWLARRPVQRWGLFDPLCIEPAQRNRVFASPRPSDIIRGAKLPRWIDRRLVEQNIANAVDMLDAIGWDLPTARILLCDGPKLLGYFGVTAPKLRPVQVTTLRSLIPDLVRRLHLESRLDARSLGAGAIDAVLEALPAAAFLVDGRGVILHANRAARAWFDSDPAVVRECLRRRGGPDGRVFDVSEIAPHACKLAVRRDAPRDSEPRARAAALRWELTPRQTEVLLHLAQGATNARIAAELGCAEATVEIHVSRILDKAEVGNRAELIAAIWSM
jgi:DNA-binding CsgD family transcriptional regulator